MKENVSAGKGSFRPIWDPGFLPAVLWNHAYREKCKGNPDSTEAAIAISRPDGTVFVHRTPLLPHEGKAISVNNRYVDRRVKFLLWREGGSTITFAGNDAVAETLRQAYAPGGSRAFDAQVFEKAFLEPLSPHDPEF